MKDELKQLIDNFLNLIKTGANAEAVGLVQYFIRRISDEQRKSIIDAMTKAELIKFMGALVLAWKEANELSAAQNKQLLDAFGMILLKCIALAFEPL